MLLVFTSSALSGHRTHGADIDISDIIRDRDRGGSRAGFEVVGFPNFEIRGGDVDGGVRFFRGVGEVANGEFARG